MGSVEEYSMEKKKRFNNERGFPRHLIVLLCLVVVFGIGLVIAERGDGKKDSSVESYLRMEEVKKMLGEAKKEIEESEKAALLRTEGELEEMMSEAETTVKKALKELLVNHFEYSAEEEKEVEEAVVAELESGVRERIEKEASTIKEDAQEDLELIVENDVESNVPPTKIENDVSEMRDYFSKEAADEINYAGKIIKHKMRDIIQDVEKKTILNKLGLDVTDKELQSSELQSKVTEVTDQLTKTEDNKIKEMNIKLNSLVDQIKSQIQKELYDFLLNKGFSLNEINQVSKQASDQFDKLASQNLLHNSNDLKDEMDGMAHQLDNIVQEDRNVIAKAKELGLQHESPQSELDTIENDIHQVQQNLNDYLENSIGVLASGLKQDLLKVAAQLEKDALEDKGIHTDEINENDRVNLMIFP